MKHDKTQCSAVQCTGDLKHMPYRITFASKYCYVNKRQRSNYLKINAWFINLIYLLRQSMRRRSLFGACLSLSVFLSAFFRCCHQLIHVNLWREKNRLFILLDPEYLFYLHLWEKLTTKTTSCKLYSLKYSLKILLQFSAKKCVCKSDCAPQYFLGWALSLSLCVCVEYGPSSTRHMVISMQCFRYRCTSGQTTNSLRSVFFSSLFCIQNNVRYRVQTTFRKSCSMAKTKINEMKRRKKRTWHSIRANQ